MAATTGSPRGRRPVVGVIGASVPSPDEQARARDVGRLLGERRIAIVTGGLGGVMAAASQGAREAGGMVLGLLPGDDPNGCNPWVELAIATGAGDARNAVIANTADAFIAIGGGLGTLTEIAFALGRGKVVVALGTWNLDPARLRGDEPLRRAATPAEAVDVILEVLGSL